MSRSRPVRRRLNVLGVVGLLAAVVGGSLAVPVGGASRASAASLSGLVTFAEGNAGNCNGPTIKTFNATSGAVTALRGGQKPVFSPDGRRIAFVDGVGLGVMNADGSGLSYYGSAVENWVQWSPDGTELVTAGADGITIVPLNGGPTISVTNNIGTPFISGPVPTGGTYSSQAISDINPTWSPTSDQVVFARSFITDRVNTNGAHFPPVFGVDLFSVHADGTGLQQLTGGPLWLDDGLQEQDEQPVFSPDGKSIAYRHYDATVGNYQIYVVGSGGGTGVNHTNRAQATNPHDASPSATWTPQNQLVWAYADTGAITVDGGATIYTAPGGVCGLSWGGSGRPPTANFSWNGGGANTFNFLSTSTAASPATITGYSWDFGDGTTSTTGPNVSHAYISEAASRTVTLTVTDSNGAQATSTQTMGPDLVVSDATSTPPSPAPGQVASLAVTVRNDGPASVTGVVPSLTFTEPAVTVGAASPVSVDLAPGASTTFTYPYTASALGPIHAQIGASGTTGGNPVVATTVTRVLTVVGAVTATLTPSTTSPVAGAQFTLDLHVTNTSGDPQDLVLGVPTASPSAGVTVTPPVGTIAPLADGASTDLTYTATIAQPGAVSLTAPLTATDQSTSVVTNLAPVATVTAVPISIVVNSTADDALPPAAAAANACDVDPNTPGDQCTLRAAIQLANLQTGAQSITFDIPGGGVPTIAPATALPALTVPVSIDGTTQTGGWVQLSGTGAPTATGLSITGGTSTVRGLVVNGWTTGISLTGAGGDFVAGNRIGTDPTGTAAVSNGTGIGLYAPDSTIGATTSSTPGLCSGDCNVISGNSAYGIYGVGTGPLPNPDRSKVVGNVIGTDVTGSVAIPNALGVQIGGAGVMVGGPSPVPGVAPGNLVSGNTGTGMATGSNAPTEAVKVEGNLVGATWNGLAALRNDIGIDVEGGADVIGGPAPEDGNVVVGSRLGISGKGLIQGDRIGIGAAGNVIKNIVGVGDGVICGDTISGNTTGIDSGSIELGSGNRIGTDPTGTVAIPNQIGIATQFLLSVSDPRCGNLGPDVVSGNTQAGVSDQTTDGNMSIDIGRMYVGTDASGTKAIPNGVGFQLTGGAPGIGGIGAYSELVDIGGFSADLHSGPGQCGTPCVLISGNTSAGISFAPTIGSTPPAIIVHNTWIGVGSGGQPLPNAGAGITSALPLVDGVGNNRDPSPGFTSDIIANNPTGISLAQGGSLHIADSVFHDSTTAVSVAGGYEPDLSGNSFYANTSDYKVSPAVTSDTGTAKGVTASLYRGNLSVGGQMPADDGLRFRVDIYGDASCVPDKGIRTPLGSVVLPYSPLATDFSVQVGSVPATIGAVAVTVTDVSGSVLGAIAPIGRTGGYSTCATVTQSGPSAAQANGSYQAVAANGSVSSYGPGASPALMAHGVSSTSGQLHASLTSPPVSNKPFVGMASTPDGGGYWLVAADGGVFASGDAAFYGSTGGIPLNAPMVGIASTPSGKGYWLVASDGGVFAFGDAGFDGSMGDKPLNRPIVGIASSSTGDGYLLAASDGGVFAFGDAAFHGSLGGTHLNLPVTGIASTPSGGYWLVASDGGVFSFDAPYLGSMGGKSLNAPVVGMAASPDGGGYWLIGSDGGVFNFGDATFSGAAVGSTGGTPVVGITRTYG